MSDLPSHKVKKYDRQLRLWGDHGQAALEHAKICLIHATSTGTEVLKNLILPGIGSFCIVDSAQVTASDLGSNFFVTAQSLASSRAEVTTRLLLEMNTDVKGDYVAESLESLLEHRPMWFTSFSIVIASDISSEKLLVQLSETLWDAGVPLIICRTYGLIGYVRIVCREHVIVESKPDNFVEDVRLDEPFPELQDLASSIDLETLTKQQHSHVPWIILMLKFLDRWKGVKHSLPVGYKEKKGFENFLYEGRLKKEDGNAMEEENFEEARRSVIKSIGIPKVPTNVQELFDDAACDTITASSSKFWIILRAIRDFVHTQGAGHLPLSGSLPDMTADSESFVTVQQLYRKKADEDFQAVLDNVRQICSFVGISKDLVKVADVKYFCRNAAFLRCVRTSRLRDEYQDKATLTTALQGTSAEDADFRCSVWYLLLRSIDSFCMETGRVPGSDGSTVEADVHQLKAHAQKYLKTINASQEFCGTLTDEILEKYCKEAVKYGGEPVHSVAAFLGGCAGQEVIKLLTGQYVPLINTLIYDGTASLTSSFVM